MSLVFGHHRGLLVRGEVDCCTIVCLLLSEKVDLIGGCCDVLCLYSCNDDDDDDDDDDDNDEEDVDDVEDDVEDEDDENVVVTIYILMSYLSTS